MRFSVVTLSTASKILGDGAAYLSLACCVSFWILLALYFLVGFDPLPRLTGFEVFKVMGVALVLAIVSLIFRSKLWKFALPFAVVMLFFTMYVMGS